MKAHWTMIAVAMGAGLVGCVTPGDRSAYRDPSEVDRRFQTAGVDHTDYNHVVTVMIESMLNQDLSRRGHRPVIAQGTIANTTAFNVQTQMIMDKIRVEGLRSRTVRWTVASDEAGPQGAARDLFRQLEFQNHSGHVNPAAIAQFGQVIGANYVLFGRVFNVRSVPSRRGPQQTYFSFILNLFDTETGEVIWADEAEITKVL